MQKFLFTYYKKKGNYKTNFYRSQVEVAPKASDSSLSLQYSADVPTGFHKEPEVVDGQAEDDS